MWLEALVLVVSIVAAAVASVVGFGIGSLLTPTFGLVVSTNTAVAAVSIPHLIGTAVRFWLMRASVDRRVLMGFGLTSAAGGLTGALLQHWTGSGWLTVLFGSVLLFVAGSEISGLARRMRFHGAMAWIAGALSGMLGGLVGNQGGIRSAALLGFDVRKDAFVASATAMGLIVDGARMPVYFVTQRDQVLAIWPMVAIATIGVIVGTLFGKQALARVPESRFRLVVAGILALLGAAMVVKGIAAPAVSRALVGEHVLDVAAAQIQLLEDGDAILVHRNRDFGVLVPLRKFLALTWDFEDLRRGREAGPRGDFDSRELDGLGIARHLVMPGLQELSADHDVRPEPDFIRRFFLDGVAVRLSQDDGSGEQNGKSN